MTPRHFVTAIALTFSLTISIWQPTVTLAQSADTWQTFLAQGQKQLESKSLTAAEVSFRQALRSIERVPHSQDDLVLCMISLADLLQKEDFKEESWKLYRKSLKALEKQYGKESIKLVPVLVTMGSVNELDGEYQKATAYYQRSVDLARQQPDSFQLASCLHNLGHAQFKSEIDGSYKSAEDSFRSALKIMMTQDSLPSDAVLELLSDYIDLMHKYQGPAKILTSQYEVELLKDQVQELGKTRAVPRSAWQQEILRRQAPPGLIVINNDASDNVSNTGGVESFSTVAQLLSAVPDVGATTISNLSGDSDRVDYYERMVAIDSKTLGPQHPSVARDLKGLAAVYVSQHRYSEARPLLERALEIYQNVYSADDLSVKRLKILLSLLDEQNKSGIASDALPVIKIPLQAQTFEVAQRLNELAFLAYEQGKLEDARACYGWALSSITEATGARSVFVAACLQDYLRVMLSSGEKSEAEKMQAQARSILAEALSQQLLRIYK